MGGIDTVGHPLLTLKSIWTSSRVLLSLIAIGGLVTLGLVLASAVWASRESDVAALDRQRELVENRLHKQVEDVASELELMAEGYANVIFSSNENAKIDVVGGESFGHIVRSIFGYDQAFVVSLNGQMALQTDSEAAGRYEWIRPLLAPMLQRATQTSADGGEPAQIVELMRLEGRPSLAGVVPITRMTSETSTPTQLYLIAYRYIDGPALDAFSQEQGLDGARFARASDPEANEVSFQINATGSQEPLGFIIWTPDLPGSRVVVRLVPALTTSAIIVAGLLGVLMVLLHRSLSDLQQSERKARHRSLHDILTDLPNRALFAQRLGQCLEDQRLSTKRSLVALVDLDKFKAVNDTHGHGAGDELIQAVAVRISGLLGNGDMLARLGGDEFALLLPDRAGDDRSYLDLCNRIVEELSKPFTLLAGKANASISCSIGITTVGIAAQSASEVLHLADIALYEAKSAGRGRCVEYSASMNRSATLREELKTDLSTLLRPSDTSVAMKGQGLEVFYQTIHRAVAGDHISGAEALVRWRHPTHGLLTPDKFISLAEDSGLILDLGSFVLRQACATAALWQNGGVVSVNVSPIQLRRPEFPDEVLHILDQTGLPPNRLELEVTETALMGGDEFLVQATLARLRAHCVMIALDDFGTGYSSLSHLIIFGIDRIKIDRSFVALLGTRKDGAAIVSAVVALSHSLGLATTAEGVETNEQRDFLIAAGCSDLQGFLFSRPVIEPDMTLKPPKAARPA
ncbi:MAG: diguanylate phosphodiesterase [Devosia sp.]|nr:diguanylate phosphodiesterase [Devosia sp.]